jgi:NAD(P)-dependent dehydrogenase (short-subunit alcohol dehydrogenase family)
MNRLAGRIAIVTGGAGAIGSATAQRLADEGAHVVVADIDESLARSVAERIGPSATAMYFDAADETSIEALVTRTISQHGRLDILHNNAANMEAECHARDTTAADIPFAVWDKVIQVNLRGYLAGCKYALPHMIAGGGGSIINTASDSGVVGDIRGIAYGVSKAGVIALTKFVAVQHGRQNIRCNAISPGLVVTPGAYALVPDLIEIIGKHVLTPRLGVPEDIAALVAFLASDEAGYITGQNYQCDGGVLAHQPQIVDVRALMARAAQ